jgi:hypothetical protein
VQDQLGDPEFVEKLDDMDARIVQIASFAAKRFVYDDIR